MKQIKTNNKHIVASGQKIRSTVIEKENWFSHPYYCKIDNGDNALLRFAYPHGRLFCQNVGGKSSPLQRSNKL